MIKVLGRKSDYRNDDVQAVWETIPNYVSEAEAMTAVRAAAEELVEVAGSQDRHLAWGWSGGKDSVALQVVVDNAGVPMPALVALYGDLEFPEFRTWAYANLPPDAVVYDRDIDINWLAARLGMLFPTDSKTGYFWTLQGTRWAQHRYFVEHNPSMLVVGRRRADNNFVPKRGRHDITTDRAGRSYYSPIRDWSHELTLAVCYYSGYPMPPTYRWPEGWTCGTGPWPGRHRPEWTRMDAWANTYSIDPDVVIAAADRIESAAVFLEERENQT